MNEVADGTFMRRHDSFRLEFGRDQPVKVVPLQVRVKAQAQPTMAQPSLYSPDNMDFLERCTSELLEGGLVFLYHRSRWRRRRGVFARRCWKWIRRSFHE